MNFRRHNQDLLLLQAWGSRPRHGRTPGWVEVDWAPTAVGGNMVVLRGLSLLPVCNKDRATLRFEATPDLYHPVADGARLTFYRNIWVDHDLEVFHPTHRRWVRLPRLQQGAGRDGLSYLCLHPDSVPPDKNVLWLLAILDLFVLNPGYRAVQGEEF